jgi:hypothetical protein
VINKDIIHKVLLVAACATLSKNNQEDLLSGYVALDENHLVLSLAGNNLIKGWTK